MRKIGHRVDGTGLAQGADRSLVGAHEGLVVEVAFAPEPHEEYPITQHTRQAVQHQRVADATVHVAPAHGLGEGAQAGGVDLLRGRAQLAALEDAEDHASDALFLRIAAFDEVVHFSAFYSSFGRSRECPQSPAITQVRIIYRGSSRDAPVGAP